MTTDLFDFLCKNITRLLWGGYLVSLLVAAVMMVLTCARALRKSLASPFFLSFFANVR